MIAVVPRDLPRNSAKRRVASPGPHASGPVYTGPDGITRIGVGPVMIALFASRVSQ